MSDRMKDSVTPGDSGNDGGQGGERRLHAPGTVFKDNRGNTFYYDASGQPRYVGLDINGTSPRPASLPDAVAHPAMGLAEPGYGRGAGGPARAQGISAMPGTGREESRPQAMDDVPSYNVNSSDYRIAARKAFNDYLNALSKNDAQALARAQREMIANPPDSLKRDTGPQMRAYDPYAEALKAQRFQTDMLGAVSIGAAEMGGLAYMLHKDEDTRRRWMEAGAEIGAELSPFAAAKGGLLRNPAARDSMKPVGVPADIGDKGAAMEGAARLDAHQRGAVKVFDAKYEGDRGFDGAYVMRNQNGEPQLHVDSVKAVNGRVPVYGRGSMTELGTNRAATRARAEAALRKNILEADPDENFSLDDKKTVLDQLNRGDLVANLVGTPGTQFNQNHIDFVNQQTPYRFGSIRRLDPFSPSKEPLLNGAAYGLPSVYWQDANSGSDSISSTAPTSEQHR